MVSNSLLRVIIALPGPQLRVSPGDIPWSRCKTPAYAMDVRAVDHPPGASWIRHKYPRPAGTSPTQFGSAERSRFRGGLRFDSRRLLLALIRIIASWDDL